MKYENINCPVCNKAFADGDDIVVCPDCGTPHHRECYKESGHCAMESKHSEGYVFLNPNTNDEGRIRVPGIIEEKKPVQTKGKNAMGATVEAVQNDRGQSVMEVKAIMPDDKIDDTFTAKEYGEFVQTSKNKFIPKFLYMEKTGRKFTWNWAAFFFPIPWLFYRKMFKIGILAAILSFIIPIVFASEFTEYSDNIMALTQQVMESDSKTAYSDLQKAMPDEPLVVSINRYISIIVNFAVALMGNYWYKQKCKKEMTRLKEKTENREEYEKAVYTKGGASIWTMILALVVIYAIYYMFFYLATNGIFDIVGIFRG